MNKKQRELSALERARDLRPDLFAGEILPGEAPDFVLIRARSRNGVEITRFVHEPRPGEPIGEEQTGLRWKILNLAKKKFAAVSKTQLRVGAVFRPGMRLRSDRVQQLATDIANYFKPRLDRAVDWTRAKWNADDDENIPKELSSVFATVVPSSGNTHWYPAQAGWVSTATVSEVSRIVGAKEKRVGKYREDCDQLWLVIVFEGTPHSARAIHAPVEPISFSVDSSFDRVFCLDVLENRLVEVPVSVPAA